MRRRLDVTAFRACFAFAHYTPWPQSDSHLSNPDMSDRVKKELEEKKAKLAELRRAREERRAILAQGEKAQAEVRS